MPAGVEVLVEDGFAIIDFTDQALRGRGLAKLLERTPPEFIEKLTRGHGPRPVYRVPEGNAREAGLLDDSGPVDELAEPDPVPKGYDDGQPDMDWSRKDIDDYAAKLTPSLDTTGEPNKQAALAAIASAPKGP